MSKGQIKCKPHMARVAELPCAACHHPCQEVHHIRQSGITGGSQKASDWLVIPMCAACHRELHAGIKTWEMRYGRQIDHVINTLDRLYR